MLDTNIYSELNKPAPAEEVVATLSGRRASDNFMSVVTLAELWRGVEQLEHRLLAQ